VPRPKIWKAPLTDQPPLALLSFNRPHYLRQVVDSLAKQAEGLDQRPIHVFQDGAVNAYSGIRRASDQDIETCKRIVSAAFPHASIHASERNLGICENILRAETHMFQTLGCETAYFIEDDFVLAPYFLQAMDLVFATVRGIDAIGYFSVSGDRVPWAAKEEPAGPRSLVCLSHHWAFGLKRSHWLDLRRALQPYYDLVVGRDYQQRDHAAIWQMFRRTGLSHPATSQDGAKSLMTCAIGRWRATTIDRFGRNIGEVGTHVTRETYAASGYGKTALFLDRLAGVDTPSPAALARAIAQERAVYQSVHDAQSDPSGSAVSESFAPQAKSRR
jgi:hypothetical protein